MARPKVPLISKRETLAVALRIIDNEGLDALSIRRLATELDVNGASLYYHFRNKEEILAGAAWLALKDAKKPEDPNVGWQEWFLTTTLNYRAALLAHPGLVAIVLSNHPLRIGLKFTEDAAEILTGKGLPEWAVLPLIETVEAFVIGTVVYSFAAASDKDIDIFTETPHLASARKAQAATPDELFVPSCVAMMNAILSASAPRSKSSTAKAKAKNSPVSKAAATNPRRAK